MTGITLSLALQAAMLTSGADGYADAYRATASNGKPLVVLVGTDWCPGCRTMKQGVIPRLLGRGKMRNVNFAQVNSDDDWNLASQLLTGDTIPQLIVFTPTENGWKRELAVGAKSDAEVEAMIDRAVEATKGADRISMTPKSTEENNSTN